MVRTPFSTAFFDDDTDCYPHCPEIDIHRSYTQPKYNMPPDEQSHGLDVQDNHILSHWSGDTECLLQVCQLSRSSGEY